MEACTVAVTGVVGFKFVVVVGLIECFAATVVGTISLAFGFDVCCSVVFLDVASFVAVIFGVEPGVTDTETVGVAFSFLVETNETFSVVEGFVVVFSGHFKKMERFVALETLYKK